MIQRMLAIWSLVPLPFLKPTWTSGSSRFTYCWSLAWSHVQMWELDHKEGWALKNWCFQTVLLKKTLESPFDSKGIKPVNPKGNQSWMPLKGLMLQYFGHLMQSVDSLEKNVMLGEIEGRKRRGWQRMRWLYDITSLMDMSLSKLWETVKDREAWHAVINGVGKSWTWLSEWTAK